MSFLGITPGQGNRFAAERTLAQKRLPPLAGEHHGNAYDLLAKHGTWFGGRALPARYAPLVGEGSRCHGNAVEAALQDPSLRLFTGFYCVGLKLLHHSWCVDPGGQVVEVTFPTIMPPGAGWMVADAAGEIPWIEPQHWLYLGVEYEAEFVWRAWNLVGLPLLDPHYPEGEAIWHHPYRKQGFPLGT